MSSSKLLKPPKKYCRGEEPVPSLLNHYRGHKGSILSLQFHPNAQTLFSSSADGYIMNWNYKTESRALRFEGHCKAVNEVALSKHGDLMVSASDDCTVRIWVPIISGQYIEIKGHQGPVKSACFSPTDSTVFATASTDKTVKVWSVQTAKMKTGVTKFKSHDFIQSFCHNNWVRSVRFSPDGRLLCSTSDDKSIRAFDLRSKELISKLPCDLGSPLKADFNPCGSTYIGVASSSNAFLMYDLRQQKLVQSYQDLFDGQGAVTSFSFHPSGDFAVCVSEEPKIKILDLIEGRPIFTLQGPRKGLLATGFSPDGSLFATGGKDQEILIWEPVLIPYDSGADEKPKTETEKSGKTGNNSENSDTKENLSTAFTQISKSNSKSNADATTTKNRAPSSTTSNLSKDFDTDSLSRTSSARSATSVTSKTSTSASSNKIQHSYGLQ